MIAEDTVFILGAGASKPYGFPLGGELVKEIYSSFYNRFEAILAKVKDPDISEEMLEAAKPFVSSLSRSSSTSIDLFLAGNQHFSNIGKLAIAVTILRAERESQFWPNTDSDKDWYAYLFQRMREELKSPDSFGRFADNKVTFVTFNYDRSLEFYLSEALVNSFAHVDRAEIESIISQIPVYHVHGTVDKAPWLEEIRRYRSEYSYHDINNLKANIELIDQDEPRDNKKLDVIKEAINSARSVYFLGFGYSKENLEAIGIFDHASRGRSQAIYGTAYGMVEEERKRIMELLRFREGGNTFPRNCMIEICDCKMLLRKHLK